MTKAFLALAAVLTAACSETLSVDASLSGETRILMQQEEPASQATPDSTSPSSFKVSVVAIEVMKAGVNDSTAWTRINLSSATDVDLMALPGESASAQLIASARLEAGSYARIRLVVSNPRVKFAGTTSFGAGRVFEGNTEYSVRLRPSETRITIEAGFDVEADASSDVSLVFETAETLSQLSMNAAGELEMIAKVRAR
jgi:hypothetical protein